MSRGHTDWCAADHRCNLGEHRGEPLVVDVGDTHLVFTRVRTRRGQQYVEVIASAPLHDVEAYARAQFTRVVNRLVRALGGTNRVEV